MTQFTIGDFVTIATVLLGWIGAVVRMDKRLAVMEEIVKRHDRWIDQQGSKL